MKSTIALVTVLLVSTVACKQRSYSEESDVTEASGACSSFTVSVRGSDENYAEVSKNCDTANKYYYVFGWISGKSDGERKELFSVSARDFPDHEQFLNRRFGRLGLLGFRLKDQRFLESDVLPLYSQGDEISKRKAQQTFVDYLIKTYGG